MVDEQAGTLDYLVRMKITSLLVSLEQEEVSWQVVDYMFLLPTGLKTLF